MMGKPQITCVCTPIYGELQLGPVQYRIVEAPRRWFERQRFYIVSEFGRVGPLSRAKTKDLYKSVFSVA